MNKTIISVILIVVVLALGLKLISGNKLTPESGLRDLKNISVKVGEEKFDLISGFAEKEIADGSATKNKLSIFGEPVMGDLDGDGDEDSAMLLLNESGGSGSFFYAVLAINESGKYKATNTMLLGDRISPQTVEISGGRAVYNFAERRAGEPFTTPPSVGKSVWVHYDKARNEIGEWVKDFEGEVDPGRMNLGMKKWIWLRTEMSDGKVTTPKRPEAFSLTFGKDGKVSITTDCNSMGGDYKTNGPEIIFGNLFSTLMFCEGSQEQEFSKDLGEVQLYMFTSKGELVLMLKYDSGSMIFR